MIDIAFVSGRLGRAMFREEDACFALALEGSQYPIGALDFEELLRFGSE